MADDVDANGPVCKGSVLPVTIEDVLPDLLVVCLNHEAKIYRGVLMDVSKRDMPCGVNFSMEKLKKGCGSMRKSDAVACVEVDARDQPHELSALVNRHTYTLDSTTVGPRLLSPPRVDISRPLRDKNIRNMRLRPRQVLCSKCKEGVHDTKIQSQSTAKGKVLKDPVQPPFQESQPITPQIKYDTRKRRQLEAEEPSRKSRRLTADSTVSKSGPVIKISFGGPEGHSTVVEIPRKSNTPQHSDCDEGKSSPMLHTLPSRRLRKSQRKAGKRSKGSDSDMDSVCSESKGPLVTVVRRKKAKRGKHKRKHRHRNGKRHNSGQSEGNESMKENDSVKTSIVLDDAPESVVDGMVMYAGEDDESDTLSMTKYVDESEDRDGIVVLSPRHNFLLEHGHLKLGTPNKHSDTNTETSQELDLDFSDVAKDFFNNKPCLNESDSANSLSDTQYDVNSDDQENLDADFNGDFPTVTDGNGSLTPTLQPLMIRIQNRRVNKVLLDDGRAIRKGDVIWGKIHGFPWWPGRVMSISESLKDTGIIINQTAQISWFASSTMSHMACAELYPFLDDFKLRYNKRKKGSYKMAIKQATIVAHSVASQLNSTTPEFPDMEVEINVMDP